MKNLNRKKLEQVALFMEEEELCDALGMFAKHTVKQDAGEADGSDDLVLEDAASIHEDDEELSHSMAEFFKSIVKKESNGAGSSQAWPHCSPE